MEFKENWQVWHTKKMIKMLYGKPAFYWLPAPVLCVAEGPSERGHNLHSVSEVSGNVCYIFFPIKIGKDCFVDSLSLGNLFRE